VRIRTPWGLARGSPLEEAAGSTDRDPLARRRFATHVASPGTVLVDVAERRENMSGLTRRPGGSTVPKPSKPIVRPGKPPKGK
jgi:hypothetical protein